MTNKTAQRAKHLVGDARRSRPTAAEFNSQPVSKPLFTSLFTTGEPIAAPYRATSMFSVEVGLDPWRVKILSRLDHPTRESGSEFLDALPDFSNRLLVIRYECDAKRTRFGVLGRLDGLSDHEHLRVCDFLQSFPAAPSLEHASSLHNEEA